MLKKLGLLSRFNRKIKTKEDFQMVIVVLFIAFVIITKCYLAIHPYTDPAIAEENKVSALSR